MRRAPASRLGKADIRRLFELLDAEPAGEGVVDVRYLLRYLDISTVEEALAVVTHYFDEKQLRPKTRLALEELLGGAGK